MFSRYIARIFGQKPLYQENRPAIGLAMQHLGASWFPDTSMLLAARNFYSSTRYSRLKFSGKITLSGKRIRGQICRVTISWVMFSWYISHIFSQKFLLLLLMRYPWLKFLKETRLSGEPAFSGHLLVCHVFLIHRKHIQPEIRSRSRNITA